MPNHYSTNLEHTIYLLNPVDEIFKQQPPAFGDVDHFASPWQSVKHKKRANNLSAQGGSQYQSRKSSFIRFGDSTVRRNWKSNDINQIPCSHPNNNKRMRDTRLAEDPYLYQQDGVRELKVSHRASDLGSYPHLTYKMGFDEEQHKSVQDPQHAQSSMTSSGGPVHDTMSKSLEFTRPKLDVPKSTFPDRKQHPTRPSPNQLFVRSILYRDNFRDVSQSISEQPTQKRQNNGRQSASSSDVEDQKDIRTTDKNLEAKRPGSSQLKTLWDSTTSSDVTLLQHDNDLIFCAPLSDGLQKLQVSDRLSKLEADNPRVEQDKFDGLFEELFPDMATLQLHSTHS